MAKCNPSTIVVNRPNQSTLAKCVGTSTATIPNCGEVGPGDCCDKASLGPRENRDKVREQIRDAVLLTLGAPVLKIELDEQQVEFAINHALQIIEEYAPREYFDYYTFPTVSGKSVYELPASVGYVRAVSYRETGQFAFQASDLDGAIPIEYFYPGGAYASIQGGLIDPVQPIWGRAGEWALYKGYEQMYSRMSSSLGGWEWVGGYRHIKLYPVPCKPSHVIVHYIQKCKDWQCMTQSMVEGATAYCRIMLGEIRSKFQNIPGPQGGIILNGQDILQRGVQEWGAWQERLLTRWGDILPITMG